MVNLIKEYKWWKEMMPDLRIPQYTEEEEKYIEEELLPKLQKLIDPLTEETIQKIALALNGDAHWVRHLRKYAEKLGNSKLLDSIIQKIIEVDRKYQKYIRGWNVYKGSQV